MNNTPSCYDTESFPADFSDALGWIKAGIRVTRSSWSGGQFVCKATIGNLSYEQADTGDMTFVDTLVMCDSKKTVTTWSPSPDDLLSEDWHSYVEPQCMTGSDHQDLAQEELEQITEKLENLANFINDPGSTFSSLSREEQHQLRMKAAYQADYARALKRIIDGLAGEGGAA